MSPHGSPEMIGLTHMTSSDALSADDSEFLQNDELSRAYLELLFKLASRPPPRGYGHNVTHQLSDVLCPFSRRVMLDPVVSPQTPLFETGLVCERAFLKELPAPPDEDEPFNADELTPSLEMRHKVAEALKSLIAALRDNHEAQEAQEAQEDLSPEEISSIDQLSKAFSKLDPLRDLLKQSLNGKTPPMVVVIGASR